MPTFTIHCVGFDSQESTSFSAILDLAHSALNSLWQVSDEIDSDALIINLDAFEGRRMMSSDHNLPDYRVILVSEKHEEKINGHWFLRKKKNSPPSLKDLTHLLNQIEFCLNISDESAQLHNIEIDENNEIITTKVERRIAQKETRPPTITENKEHTLIVNKQISPEKLIAENYLFGLLLVAKTDKKCRVITSDGNPTLYISPKKNSYYFSGTEVELIQLCTTAQQKLQNETLPSAKLNKIIKSKNDLKAHRGLDALIGYAIFYASQGRLLEGHSAEQAIKLLKKPDVNKIPILREYQAVSESLQKQNRSLLSLVEQLQVKIPYIFDYYNICYLLGFLECTSIEPKNNHPKKPSSFFNSFFKKTTR